MDNRVFTCKVNARSVSLIYINDINKAQETNEYQTIEMHQKDDFWGVKADLKAGTPYKFLIDNRFYLLDPRSKMSILPDSLGFWSIYQGLFNDYYKVDTIEKALICKDISEDICPISITSVLTPLDSQVICYVQLTKVEKDSILTMVWRSSRNFYYAGDILVKGKENKIRKAFMGINVKDILDSNFFDQGKCFVDLFFNGYYSGTTEFNINKLNTYSKIRI